MEEIIEEKKESDKPTPFLKRVNELEKKVEDINKKLNTILMALKTRR